MHIINDIYQLQLSAHWGLECTFAYTTSNVYFLYTYIQYIPECHDGSTTS